MYSKHIMAGKGSKLRKGANLNAYWNNYPFPEKLTVSQWISKMGDKNVDMTAFSNIPLGSKITEDQYLTTVKYMEEPPVVLANMMYRNDSIVPAPWRAAYLETSNQYIMTTDEIEQLKEDMNSMSFSEFKKFKK
jgi:hypothetical protein